jgi:error-prone DNA polymerase
MTYVELHARSAFSFLQGASQPEQLAEVAGKLELPAVALSDRDGLYGAVRFHQAAKEQGVRAIIGSDLTMEDGSILPLLVASRKGYQNLARLITHSKLRSPKGESNIKWSELPECTDGLIALTGDKTGPIHQAWMRNGAEEAVRTLRKLETIFPGESLYVEIQRHYVRGEDRWGKFLTHLAQKNDLPLLATNGVSYATPDRRAVLDVFTCLRHKKSLDAAGLHLSHNRERHLKSGKCMQALFSDHPEAITNTVRLAEKLEFSLENLGYEFPSFPAPEGDNMESYLRKTTWSGARERYPKITNKVRNQLERELNLISKLGFSGYFLIVWDLINFCHKNDVMVQGRGSAANSAVCYCLGITAVDPIGGELLFERFLSEDRKSWPDIDLDLPSGDRRESVIQEVYRCYGKHGAAMTANVITYRGRSAMREVSKVLSLPEEAIERFSRLFARGDYPNTLELKEQLSKAGIPTNHPRLTALVSLYRAIYGLPRHLGQHSGGMIICQGQLDTVMPLENASMPGRVVAQWDKDDCEEMGIVKVDLLGLGMMSVLQDTLILTRQRGKPVDLAKIPKDDPATFKLMQKADTIGVFQIESRAQMATLPRMKPETFYDLVIEVAIIRPGPIQGKMLHPYLERRAGRQKIDYIDPKLEPILKRTLGVPLFQEQMLRISMVMAGFSGSEAEELRRAISFHRSEERMNKVKTKLETAMRDRNIHPDTIQKISAAISSFALYGFPESHAISFALLAYASAYLKVHHAAEFYASLLNNQPMGFYSPATLIQDAHRHGLRTQAVDVTLSQWKCVVESDQSIRLGFRTVHDLKKTSSLHMLEQRCQKAFTSMDDFTRRTHFSQTERRALAAAGALNSLAKHRRKALWIVEEQQIEEDLFSRQKVEASDPRNHDEENPLKPMALLERIQADYANTSLTVGAHPMRLIRKQLPTHVTTAASLASLQNGSLVTIAGAVICRQRPGTAKGFVFISLEDETGISNIIVTPKQFEKHRLMIVEESFLMIKGRLQHQENVIHIKAQNFQPFACQDLPTEISYDFH